MKETMFSLLVIIRSVTEVIRLNIHASSDLGQRSIVPIVHPVFSMADGTSASVSGIIIVIAILAVIGFVFFLLVFIMSQMRRLSLNRAVKKLIAAEGNDTLRVTQKDLKKMYQLIKETWDRRADIFPIPEVNRLPSGWLRTDDGRLINVRDEIVASFNKICDRATKVSLQFARLPHQTVGQFFTVLLKKRVGTLKPQTCEAYLECYNLARYGSPNINFDQAEYSQFVQIFSTILEQILPRASE
jgi:hypothetical protein